MVNMGSTEGEIRWVSKVKFGLGTLYLSSTYSVE